MVTPYPRLWSPGTDPLDNNSKKKKKTVIPYVCNLESNSHEIFKTMLLDLSPSLWKNKIKSGSCELSGAVGTWGCLLSYEMGLSYKGFGLWRRRRRLSSMGFPAVGGCRLCSARCWRPALPLHSPHLPACTHRVQAVPVLLLGMPPLQLHSSQGQLQEHGVGQTGFGPEPVALGLVWTAADRRLSFVQSVLVKCTHTDV